MRFKRVGASVLEQGPRSGGVGVVRPEIQALRAVAVTLVVLYHVCPSAVPGGFVGVDVFFALSGFLITTLLLRELDQTGRISLAAFWARRARRLLPAAIVVLLFCVAATVLVVPLTYWTQYLADVRASTLYVQNWHLAAAAVDYFAAGDDPSPVQHFWTLSAEEQFYVLWPLVILVVIILCRHRAAATTRQTVAAVLVAITAASLVYGVLRTSADPAVAYFATPARGWEFGVGGLLAFLPQSRLPEALRAAASWTGLAAIVVAALIYDSATPLPGSAAMLPVVAALTVIWAGRPASGWGPMRVLRVRPVQYLGDVSYSVYLWHWPLLVLAPFALGAALDAGARAAIVALTVAAASLTKVLVEDPLRHGRLLVSHHSAWTFIGAACAAALVLGASAQSAARVEAQMRTDARIARVVLRAPPRCFGAAARDPERTCRNDRLRLAVAPSPILARRAHPAPCTWMDSLVCVFGVAPSEAQATVALVGDSHAGHWRAALDRIARQRHWQGVSLTMTGCLFSTVSKLLPEPRRTWCRRWKARVLDWFGEHPNVDTVFVSQIAGSANVAAGRRDRFGAAVDGFVRMWHALPGTVRHIVVIRDTPRVRGDTGACVERAMVRRQSAAELCWVPRRTALAADPAAAAARRLHSARVRWVDLTRYICGTERCWPVVGGALVFSDESHLTRTFARSLAPYLARELDRIGLRAGGAGSDRAGAGSRVATRNAVGCHHADRPGTIDLRGAGTIDIRLVRGLPEPSRPRPALHWEPSVWSRGRRVGARFRRGDAAVRVDAVLRRDGILSVSVCRR